MRCIVVCNFALVLSVNVSPIWACATCLCGDPTITTMGTEKPFAGRMRAGVEYLSRGEKVAEVGSSELVTEEQRATYSFSYAISAEWIVAASVPMVTKKVKRYDLSLQQSSGVGDLDLSVRWFIGKDESFPLRHLWGMQFGLRLPTSTEQKKIDIDAQPGVGATIPNLGIWYGRYAMPWFFYTSTAYQHAVTDAQRSGYVAVGVAYGEWAQVIDVALLTSNADERQKLVNNIAASIHVYAKGLGDLPVNVAE